MFGTIERFEKITKMIVYLNFYSYSPKRSATRINHLEGQTSGHFVVNTNPDILYNEHKSGHFYSEHKSGHGTYGRTFTKEKKVSLNNFFLFMNGIS